MLTLVVLLLELQHCTAKGTQGNLYDKLYLHRTVVKYKLSYIETSFFLLSILVS